MTSKSSDKQASKNIVITGVAQGLGYALVDRFIALGHIIHGCDVQGDKISSLQQKYPEDHTFATVDLVDAARVQFWANSVLTTSPAPDLLINNAGTTPTMASLCEVSADAFEYALAVNVSGVASVIRAFVPAMVERQQGVIVNISSKWGRQGAANAAPFCASKWAVEGLTQSLALELGEGMAAVTLAPGAIATHALEVVFGKEKAQTFPTPERWAAIAAPYLLSITAEHNGQALTAPNL